MGAESLVTSLRPEIPLPAYLSNSDIKMRVEDIVVQNEVMLLKDVEEVQRAFCPAKGS